jgi:hypothetical protein
VKTCTACKCKKQESDFWADKRRLGGLMACCKVCRTVQHSKFRKERGYDYKRYWKNPVAERERHLVRKYGVTLNTYDRMFADQNGRCAICGKTQARAFDVDHCHATGKVRGLLCTSCNRVLGHANDAPETLERAAQYLRERQQITPQVAQVFIEAYLET